MIIHDDYLENAEKHRIRELKKRGYDVRGWPTHRIDALQYQLQREQQNAGMTYLEIGRDWNMPQFLLDNGMSPEELEELFPTKPIPTSVTLAEVVKTTIEQALVDAKGNRSAAARGLGVSRGMLCRRLRRYRNES
jgi:transcriptional regulator of acetoin/glycerol metabolism